MSKSILVIPFLTSLTFKVYNFLAWNPLDEHPRLWKKVFFGAAMFYTATCLLQEIIYFVINLGAENSFLKMTDLAPCAGFTTLSCVKILTVYGNIKTVRRIFSTLESFIKVPPCRPHEIVFSSKRLMKMLSICYLTLIWIFNLAPLFVIIYYYFKDGSYHKKMPYVMYYPWDCNKPIYYELSYLVVTWGAFTSAVSILSTDLMFCNMVTFVCLRFEALRSKIRRIVNGEGSRRRLRHWIDDHNELISIVDDVENIFSLSILINFLGSSLIICLVGFQTLHGVGASHLFKFCLFLVSSLLQIFVICWHGQQLTCCAHAVGEEVYKSEWITKDNQLRKDLQLIILFAQKHKSLTASKFSKVSLNSFIVIIGTSFSYFTFIRTLYDPNLIL